MKILCVSDQIDPLIYNQNAAKNVPDVDLILCAGDLPMDYVDFIVTVFNKPTYFIFGNHDLKEFKYYHGSQNAPARASTSAQSATQQALFNSLSEDHHHGAVYAGFKNLTLKNFTVINEKGKQTPLLLTGISGSIKYNDGLCQYTNFEMQLKLLALVPKLLYNKIRYGRFLDIFLTHATPRKVHDHDDPCHKGFRAFNWFIEKFNPEYMVHGHIHLYDQREERISLYKKTTVVNAFAYCVIDFNTDKKSKNSKTENKNVTTSSI